MNVRKLVEENLKEGHAYSDYELWMLFFLNGITLVDGKYANEKDEALKLIDEECCLTPCTLDDFYIYNGLRSHDNNNIHVCPQKPPVNYHDALRAIFRYKGNVCEWEPSVKVLNRDDIFRILYRSDSLFSLTYIDDLSIKVSFDVEKQFIKIVSHVIYNQMKDTLEHMEPELRKRYVVHSARYHEANSKQTAEINKQFKNKNIYDSFSFVFSARKVHHVHVEWVNEFGDYEPESVYAHCAYCVIYAHLCNELLQEIRKYFKSPDEFTLMVRLLAEWMKEFLDFDIFTMSMIYHE